jgi:ABC-type Zn2+ transport system substrate-binding protein/surface adhesin
MADEKKIIIDEDWKNKAQHEKENMKEKEEKEHHHEHGPECNHEHTLPPGDFNALVSLLATQAMFSLGLIRTEKDKEPQKDLKLAKFNIDILDSLEAKTKGNLSEEEKSFLSTTLAQLRMAFVELSK